MVSESWQWTRPFPVAVIFWLLGLVWGFSTDSGNLFFLALGGILSFLSFLVLYLWNRGGWSIFFLAGWSFAGAFYSLLFISHRVEDSIRPLTPLINRPLWFQGVVERPLSFRHAPLQTAEYTYKTDDKTGRYYKIRRTEKKKSSSLWRGIVRIEAYSTVPSWTWRPISGRILLLVRGGNPLNPKQRIRFPATLRALNTYRNFGGYDSWIWGIRRGLLFRASVRAENLSILEECSISFTNKIEFFLYKKRSFLKDWFDLELVRGESRGILKAVLLGYRGELTPELREIFARSGTSHLLAISGLHLAIAGSLGWFLGLLLFGRFLTLVRNGWHRPLAGVFALSVAGVYTILSGSSVSALRAFVMLSVLSVGLFLRRRPELPTSLAFAAFAITLFEPTSVLTVSFHLSFGAVFLLFFIGSKLKYSSSENFSESSGLFFDFWRFGRWFLAISFTSFWLSLFSLPLTLNFSSAVPLAAPIVNTVAIPLGGYGILAPGLAALAFKLAGIEPLARWSLSIASHAAEFLSIFTRWVGELSDFSLLPFTALQLFVYLGIVLSLWFFWFKKRAFAYLALIFSLVGIIPVLFVGTERKLQVNFFDVGQGSSALLKLPDGEKILIDAGGDGSLQFGWRLEQWLRKQRVSQLDIAVLTHPHPDHFGGFFRIFERFSPEQFWYSGQPEVEEIFQRQLSALKRRGNYLVRKLADLPESVQVGGVTLDLIHPRAMQYEGNGYYWAFGGNDNSTVIRVRYGSTSILFCGDIERDAESLLLERAGQRLRADILVVPHHGSKTSSTIEFLRAVRPKWALFSLGRYNRYGFPHRSVLRRFRELGIEVLRTDIHGQIDVISDGERFFINFYSKDSYRILKRKGE